MGATIPMGEGIVGTVAQTSQPLIVNDVHAEPRWNFTFDEATDFHTRDLLCVPMITQNRLIGVIEVVNKRDSDGFDEEDLEILTSFAVQAAIAIVNARRFTSTDQALAEHVQELQLLHTIDRELNSSLDLGRVLDLTLAHALDALDSSTGLIGLLPADGTALYFLASRGLGQNLDQYREVPWSLEQGIIGRVAKTGQAAIVPDVATDPDYVALDPQTRSQLTVPLIRDELVLGVISVTRETQAPFLKKDLEFVRRLAEHAAVAVKNARLFEQANAANEAKTEFMSVASHELKIPMTSIKGYARLLEMGASGDLSEQQRDFLRVIISNVDRMDRLVSDLLDVSRIEAGRIRLTKEQLDLGEVVDEVMRTVETQFQTKQLTLTIDVPPQLPRVWADHGRLIQVMTNLLSNAYKYTPEGGRVQVSASSPNGASAERRLVISVQDTGIGIHSDDRKQIFGKFFRSSDPQVQEVPGTGLGLAITKSLVEMHGGELWFESAEGQGSTFSFSLPTMHPDAPAH
jgi:signal transduction histidine kinase